MTTNFRRARLVTLLAVAVSAALGAALPARADDIDLAAWGSIAVHTGPPAANNGGAIGSFASSGITVAYANDVLTGSNASAIRIGSFPTVQHQLTFSHVVRDPLIYITNLISGSSLNSFAFDHAYTLVSGNLVANSSTRVYGTPTGASGVVRIDGDISSLSWYNECEFVGNPVSFTVGLSVAAVPEPQTYAMMAAGFGMLAFVVVRRRRNDQTLSRDSADA